MAKEGIISEVILSGDKIVTKSISKEEKSEESLNEVDRNLQSIFDISLIISIVFGFFPLSNSRNGLNFSWKSLPVVLITLRIVLSLTCAAFYFLSAEKFRSLFWSISKTEHFTEKVIGLITFFGEIVAVIDLVWKRENLAGFQKALIGFISASGESIDLSRVEFNARNLRALVIIGFFVTSGTCFARQVYVLATTTECMCWYMNLLPALTLFTFSTMYFRLFTRIWIVSILQALHVSVGSLQNKISYLSQEEHPVCLESVLGIYRRLETLIIRFNKDFGIFLSVGVASTLITILMTSFMAILFFKYVTMDVGVTFACTALVSGTVLYAMFESGTELENKMKECMLLLQDTLVHQEKLCSQLDLYLYMKALSNPMKISPGSYFHLNLRTLTTVFGSITTYLIVLVQFHANE